MEVKVSTLRDASNRLFDLLESERESVDLPVGYYHSIDADVRYRVGISPNETEISLGDLAFDLQEIEEITREGRDPLMNDLELISELLTAIGYYLAGLIPPGVQTYSKPINALQVKVSILRIILNRLLGMLESIQKSVDIPVAHYYKFGPDVLYRIGPFPDEREIEIGDLASDLLEIEKISKEGRKPLLYDFVHLGQVLKVLRDYLTGQFPPGSLPNSTS